MSRNTIIISSDPKGHFSEGTLASGQTPLPGQFVKKDSSGNYTVGSGAADGGAGPIIILLEDYGRGRGPSDAYESGGHCFVYHPVPGDEVNVLWANIGGTADTYAIGQQGMIQGTTGKIIAVAGTPIHTFTLLDAITPAMTVDTLARVRYNG